MKLFVLSAVGAFGLDVVSKWMVAHHLTETVNLGWFLHLSSVRNTGMALGIFRDNAIAVFLLPLCVVLCGWWLLRRYQPTVFKSVAAGLILGGFAGNYIQRVAQGYVLDMLYFPWLPWFVCNVADLCICFGVVLIAVSLLFRSQDWKEKTNADV